MQYLALIHKNSTTEPSEEEWRDFFRLARDSGMFKGGSALGGAVAIGNCDNNDSTKTIGGFMRFDSENVNQIEELLKSHPVILHGGSIELREMTKS